MRTTLINGALKRACDTPGCNHEWRQCPVHDVVTISPGIAIGTLAPGELLMASPVSPTCRGCGYHVCSCARPAPFSIADWAEKIRYETCDRRFVSHDELDRFPDTVEDSRLPRSEGRRDGPIDYENLSVDDRTCMLRAKLIARHDFNGTFADMVAKHHTKPMFSMLMKAQKVSAEISRENPFVVFVKGAIPPGGKFNEFFYRLDFEGNP